MRRLGFTLIELLVVIAILAILASIVLPSLGIAKRSAKKTASLSNLSQLMKATFLYAADADDKPPPYCGECQHSDKNYVLGDGPNVWMVLDFPYIGFRGKPSGEIGIFLAEDLPEIFFDQNELRKPQLGSTCEGWGTITSWGINDFLVDKLGSVDAPGENRVKSFSSLGSPAETVVFAQTKSYLCVEEQMPGFALAVPPRPNILGWDAESTVDGIYGSEMNPLNLVAFADGSAKLVSRIRLVREGKFWGLEE